MKIPFLHLTTPDSDNSKRKPGRMAKILVVDDNIDTRNIVRLKLENAGYKVILAKDGHSGCYIAHSEMPDLIVLDLLMRVMNGFTALRVLKADPDTVKIPVIILTNKMDAASERECMEAGATDYIMKPWGLEDLVCSITLALEYSRV